MAYVNRFTQSDDYRRDELIRIIEHSVEKLTLAELEALYYDMTTQNEFYYYLDFYTNLYRLYFDNSIYP